MASKHPNPALYTLARHIEHPIPKNNPWVRLAIEKRAVEVVEGSQMLSNSLFKASRRAKAAISRLGWGVGLKTLWIALGAIIAHIGGLI